MKVVLCELYELEYITFDLRIVKREAEKKLRFKSSGPRQEFGPKPCEACAIASVKASTKESQVIEASANGLPKLSTMAAS